GVGNRGRPVFGRNEAGAARGPRRVPAPQGGRAEASSRRRAGRGGGTAARGEVRGRAGGALRVRKLHLRGAGGGGGGGGGGASVGWRECGTAHCPSRAHPAGSPPPGRGKPIQRGPRLS